jgi:uncharacterized cupredoxin-like copper-binding protein
MKSPKNTLLLAAGAAPLMLFSACGSDDNASATDNAACESWFEADSTVINYLFTGQGDADSVNAALDAAIEAADPEIEQTIVDLKAEAQAQIENPELEGSDETLDLYGKTIAWAGDNCDVETLDVTAVDYRFEGVPDELSTGYHVIDFTNGGQENHEMFAFRIDDASIESVTDIFDLPEDEAFSKITPVNAVYATPGTSDVVSWDLTEPGRYAVFCAISLGSVGDSEGDGPPHFTQGMVREFTVTS